MKRQQNDFNCDQQVKHADHMIRNKIVEAYQEIMRM
ncbi:MAG: flagellar hook-basal body complex protein FliE [Deltaproteobacteria bacterium]|nr:flagellar hook-basal body complex protein FliE [Deltaproteobacteria bacterium]MBW2083786.1 flagellar hook-basal body complex protein FliE [Deltaproteobacteria bacterium]